MRAIASLAVSLCLLCAYQSRTLALEPALPPTLTTGAVVTFHGPKDEVTWKLEALEDGIYHWRSGGQRWTKRTNLGPTLTWSNSEKSGSADVAGSHAGLLPLTVGKSSTLSYTSSRGTYYKQTCTVLDIETITVPLGMFKTYPVECLYLRMKSGEITKRRVYYYSPAHRFFIRRVAGKATYDVVTIQP